MGQVICDPWFKVSGTDPRAANHTPPGKPSPPSLKHAVLPQNHLPSPAPWGEGLYVLQTREIPRPVACLEGSGGYYRSRLF